MAATLAADSRNYNKQPQKTCVTTVVFNTKLFTYTTSMNANFQTVGSLVANTAATAANCPENRVLHANGKTLIPGVNPSVTKPFIGVFDPVSGLNGFIDATDPAFANYDTNFPFQYNSGLQPAFSTLGGQGANVRQGTDAGVLTQTSPLFGLNSVNAGDNTSGEFKFAGNASTITVTGSQITVKVANSGGTLTTCTDSTNPTCKTLLDGAAGKQATVSINYPCTTTFIPSMASPCPIKITASGMVE